MVGFLQTMVLQIQMMRFKNLSGRFHSGSLKNHHPLFLQVNSTNKPCHTAQRGELCSLCVSQLPSFLSETVCQQQSHRREIRSSWMEGQEWQTDREQTERLKTFLNVDLRAGTELCGDVKPFFLMLKASEMQRNTGFQNISSLNSSFSQIMAPKSSKLTKPEGKQQPSSVTVGNNEQKVYSKPHFAS